MTVHELIGALSGLCPDYEVGLIWDGANRGDLNHVWVARCGKVMVSDTDVVYETDDRPHWAPTRERERYWTPVRRHRESCSNQNPLDPEGEFKGVEECGCDRR